MVRFGIVLLLLGVILATSSRVGAEIRTVTVSGRAVVAGETTLDQARHAALSQARTLAVERAAGVSVSSVALLRDQLMVGELVKTFAHGFLVSESNVAWRGGWSEANAGELGYPIVDMTLEAKVDVRPKTFFRDYAIDASLDKTTYRDGESARLQIAAKEDMYLLVVNYTSTGRILPLHPYGPNQPNLLKSGAVLTLHGDGAEPWDVVLRNYAGHEQDTEAFIALGFPVDALTQSLTWSVLFPSGKEFDYAEFFAAVLKLPVDWIAQDTVVYTVVRR